MLELGLKLKLGYTATAVFVLAVTLYLLLFKSNLPTIVSYTILAVILLTTIALWLTIVAPLSREEE